jgi:DNA-binding response OmpR family regulator
MNLQRPQIILLVDDNRDWVECTQVFLADEGFDVRAAFDGRQALELLATVVPAAIVLDIDLPLLDGLQVLQHIRSRFATIPVLMISADDGADVQSEAIRLGANRFLRKPVSTLLLLRAIKQHLMEE